MELNEAHIATSVLCQTAWERLGLFLVVRYSAHQGVWGFVFQGIGYNSFSRDIEYHFRSVLNQCWIAESPQVGVLTPLHCLAPGGFQRLQALVNSICFPSQARKRACAAKVVGLRRGGPGSPFPHISF